MLSDSIKNTKTLINAYIFEIFVSKDSTKRKVMANPFERNIDDAILFTINSVKEFISFLPDKSEKFLKGKNIVEIGPGQDIGVALILLGFDVNNYYIIDRFFFQEIDESYIAYYKKLHKTLTVQFPNWNLSFIEQVITSKTYSIPQLIIVKKGLEEVSEIEENSIDISFSNACFEHLYDTNKAIFNLGKITKKGGLGFHQIDFRDHRNFDKPLEFLTMSNFTFQRILNLSKVCYGNRIRPFEFQEIFRKNNFVTEFKSFHEVDEGYLKNNKHRFIQKYREMDDEKLKSISGRFYVCKS